MGASDERKPATGDASGKEGRPDAATSVEPSAAQLDDLDQWIAELGETAPSGERDELYDLLESEPEKLSLRALGLGEEELWAVLEREGIHSQKDLAKYLGVAESTLSGWLKEDRMPRMALLACLLLELKQLARKEIERLKNCLRRPHIVPDEGRFHVVALDEHPGDWIYGRFLARSLDDENTALRYARSFETENLLSDCIDVIEDMLDRTENELYKEHLLYIRYKIENVLSSWSDVEKWKNSYK